MYQLYGDGIHDDYPAIQEMIDSGACEVVLPAPKKFYLITNTLLIPSNFRLVLPRFAEIRLADGANCYMARNKYATHRADRLPGTVSESTRKFWDFVNETSPAPEHTCENFEIVGGIWNANNTNQKPNPLYTSQYEPNCFPGYIMLFYNVKNFKLSSMTFKDPVNFAVALDRASYFTVEDITFDFNLGNPYAINMDGIHLDGNCHHGHIRNLKGACYDDLVALNAHEGSAGPITHIDVDGIYAEGCHSAVRLLAVTEKIQHVHITNVHGTFYQYCIEFSKFYSEPATEYIDDISIDHIYASKAVRPPQYPWPDSYVYPLVRFDGIHVKNVTIQALHRRECNVPIDTIYVSKTAQIDSLIISDVTTENYTGKPIPVLANHGHIKDLTFRQVRTDGDQKIVNDGKIDHIAE